MDEYKEYLKNAKMLLVRGDPEQAFIEAQKAIGAEPNLQEGYLLAGKAKFESGHYNEAITLLETAQLQKPLDSVSEKLLNKAKELKEKTPAISTEPTKTTVKRQSNCCLDSASCCDPHCVYCCPDEMCVSCDACGTCCEVGSCCSC